MIMTKMSDPAAIAAGWWRGLQPYKSNGERNPKGDRAALARLRRSDLGSAVTDPATLELFTNLGERFPDSLPRIALAAAVLAAVREDDPSTHPARHLGLDPANRDRRPLLSRLRFQRLILAEDAEERLMLFRRAVQLARGRINVRSLAEALLGWTEPRRQRWVFEYYAAGAAAPASHFDKVDSPGIEDAKS